MNAHKIAFLMITFPFVVIGFAFGIIFHGLSFGFFSASELMDKLLR